MAEVAEVRLSQQSERLKQEAQTAGAGEVSEQMAIQVWAWRLRLHPRQIEA